MLFRALALVCLALPAAAEELRFDVGMRGVRAAQLVLQGEVADGRYAVSGQVRGTGLVGAIVEIDFGADARGRAGGRLRPAAAELRDDMGDERGRTRLEWSGGVPRVTQRTPPWERQPWDVSAEAQSGSVDPLTSMYDVLRTQPADAVCNRRIDMFDGRRASAILLAPARATADGLVCSGEYRRVAGFEPEDMAARTRFPFTLTYAVADGEARAIELRAATKYGDAVLRRR